MIRLRPPATMGGPARVARGGCQKTNGGSSVVTRFPARRRPRIGVVVALVALVGSLLSLVLGPPRGDVPAAPLLVFGLLLGE